MNYVSLPRTTINMIPRGGESGLEDQRVLLVGQITGSGASASAGLVQDVPRTKAEVYALFGKGHLGAMAWNFRKNNKYTNLDAIAIADASGTAATAVVLFEGTATENARLTIQVVSAIDHVYNVDVEVDDDEAAIMAKLLPLVTADAYKPFAGAKSTDANTDDTITFTANNDGTFANKWGIRVIGSVAGITVTVTGWASGATDPTIAASLFDPVANIRYQGVVWPATYSTSVLKTWIDGRKNLDNSIMDGVGIYYLNDSLANAKTEALTRNSSEVVVLGNKPNAASYNKGPHILEAPENIAAQFASIRALRFEQAISITNYVTAIESLDQFGGIHTASLPYFNTIFPNLPQPERGTGWDEADQLEAEQNGVAVLGSNRQNNGMLAGVIVTTYQNDGAGNDDDTWKYLNWRDTHSILREYYVTNFRKKFAQHRMTTGDLVPGYAMANEDSIRAYVMHLYSILEGFALVVAGPKAQKYVRNSTVVTILPAERRFHLELDLPIVSQAENITGTIKFNFGTSFQ